MSSARARRDKSDWVYFNGRITLTSLDGKYKSVVDDVNYNIEWLADELRTFRDTRGYKKVIIDAKGVMYPATTPGNTKELRKENERISLHREHLRKISGRPVYIQDGIKTFIDSLKSQAFSFK